MLSSSTKIHFIGIGGIGMSGLALLLLESGYIVSGSDEVPSHITERINAKGGRVFSGHKASNLGDAQLVIYSSAISDDNPELLTARKKEIPVLHRAELLAELMKDKTGIAITGTHGKTTTSCLLASVLIQAGLDPTLVLGGELKGIDGNTRRGKGELLLAEADESDGSFLFLEPKYSVITNIDTDHLDHYGSLEGLIKAGSDFAKKTKTGGELFCLFDDLNIRRILLGYEGRFTTFGLYKEADLHAERIEFKKFQSEFDCIYKKENLGRVKLNLPGSYNITNSLAAILVSLHLGIEFDTIKQALSSYSGVKRRFETKVNQDGIMVVEDYAHHPTEIKEVLKACTAYGEKRLVVVFQPHRYTRTKHVLDDFADCFKGAHELILTNIYSAWEEPIRDLSIGDIYQKVVKTGQRNVHIMPKKNIADYLYNNARPNDLILILGAGDICEVSDKLASLLKEEKLQKI